METRTAELWDPVTGAWSELPPMAERRCGHGCCVLPSGRVAVVGGPSATGSYDGGEVYDPVARTWQPLPPMGHRSDGVVAVAGGLLSVGRGTAELFDEESWRWFQLPEEMADPRNYCSVVSVPAAALAPSAASQ